MKCRRSNVARAMLELARPRVASDSCGKGSALGLKRVPGNVRRPAGAPWGPCVPALKAVLPTPRRCRRHSRPRSRGG